MRLIQLLAGVMTQSYPHVRPGAFGLPPMMAESYYPAGDEPLLTVVERCGTNPPVSADACQSLVAAVDGDAVDWNSRADRDHSCGYPISDELVLLGASWPVASAGDVDPPQHDDLAGRWSEVHRPG